MRFEMANGKHVEASQEEIDEFITLELIPNPYWKYSLLLAESEVMSYLRNESTQDGLVKVAKYLLIFIENLSFTNYLFEKSEGKLGVSKELNMPVIKQLRNIYHRMSNTKRPFKKLSGDVHEMENACMTIGADPL